MRRIFPALDVPRSGRIDDAVPDGGHAAHDGSAHQHQHPRPPRRIEDADHPFVAGKETGNGGCGGRADREQIPRHVDHLSQVACAGHVDAVIVARAQVDGGELTVHKVLGQLAVTGQQGRGRVVVPLGLEDATSVDVPQLTDGAIHRADQISVGQRPGTRTQRPGKEGIETGVGRRIRLGGLLHVHLILLNEATDRPLGERTAFKASASPGQPGERLLGQQVLGERMQVGHGQATRHRTGSSGKPAMLLPEQALWMLLLPVHRPGFRDRAWAARHWEPVHPAAQQAGSAACRWPERPDRSRRCW